MCFALVPPPLSLIGTRLGATERNTTKFPLAPSFLSFPYRGTKANSLRKKLRYFPWYKNPRGTTVIGAINRSFWSPGKPTSPVSPGGQVRGFLYVFPLTGVRLLRYPVRGKTCFWSPPPLSLGPEGREVGYRPYGRNSRGFMSVFPLTGEQGFPPTEGSRSIAALLSPCCPPTEEQQQPPRPLGK